VTRPELWLRCRRQNGPVRLGASPLKRMTASWFGSHADPTEYKVAARCFVPNGRLPSDRTRDTRPLNSLSLSTGQRRLTRERSIGVALWTGCNQHRNPRIENALNPYSALDSKSPIQGSGRGEMLIGIDGGKPAASSTEPLGLIEAPRPNLNCSQFHHLPESEHQGERRVSGRRLLLPRQLGGGARSAWP
jgi:hypothetical protein